MSSRGLASGWSLPCGVSQIKLEESRFGSRGSHTSSTPTTTATTAAAAPFFFSLGGGGGTRGGTAAAAAAGSVGPGLTVLTGHTSKSGSDLDPHSSSSAGGGHLMTLARVWAMWRAISWLNAHKQFMGLGVVLAEYATKSALSHLPHEQEYRCEQLLRMIGLDVEKVGLDTVGQSALSVAMTGGGFDAMVPGPLATRRGVVGLSTDSQRFDVERLMQEIVHIASMPQTLEAARHKQCAAWLQSGWTIHRAAVAAYGPRDAVWTKGGLHRNSAQDSAHWQCVTCGDLQAAYTASRQRAVAAEPVVRWLGPSALRAMAPI